MSRDQQTGKFKIVSGRTPQGRRGDRASVPSRFSPLRDDDITAAPDRPSLLFSIIFLSGCLIGGTGLAAWPHLAG